MTGLIRNNFYSMEGNIKLSFLLTVVLAVAGCLIRSRTAVTIVIAIQAALFVVNSGTSLHADEVAKWNKYEVTLPVDRSTIIGAKYISMALLILFGFIMGIITVVLAKTAGAPLNFDSVVWGFGFGLSLAFATVAFMYPVMLKIGTEKSEMIICVAAFCAMGFMMSAERLLAPILGVKDFKHPVNGIVLTVISLGLFALSYFVALWIHQKKEF